MKTLPSPEGFRKARWIRRKRSLIGFFVFLASILVVLFFDYYMVAISKFFAVRSSKEIEEKAGELSRMSDKERHKILSEIRYLMTFDRVEEARVKVLKYLERENSAEGNYLAATVYLRQGDIQSAYRYLKEAVRINPDYYEAKQK
ncbi:MAG TPA: tetratricopeptide repeat protein, partial [Syntrophales bacterium]|nr:tetratricopeptide repeat protein [Syntrophales bacterium]